MRRGHGGVGEKEGHEDLSGCGWITLGKTCRREKCQGKKCKIGPNGGNSYEPSASHNSWKGSEEEYWTEQMYSGGLKYFHLYQQ